MFDIVTSPANEIVLTPTSDNKIAPNGKYIPPVCEIFACENFVGVALKLA